MAKRSTNAYLSQRLVEIETEPRTGLKAFSAFRYRNLVREKNRHGTTVYYYRQGKGPRVRLPDPNTVTEDVFNRAYAAAKRGEGCRPDPAAPLPTPNYAAGKPGFVYFIRSGDAVKIGFSRSLRSRFAGLQTSSHDDLQVLAVIPGTDQTERYFHLHFKAYRKRGEWFALEGELAAFLSACPSGDHL